MYSPTENKIAFSTYFPEEDNYDIFIINDDGTNKALDNLRLLCYNCFYILKGKRHKIDIPKNVRGFQKAVGSLFSSES